MVVNNNVKKFCTNVKITSFLLLLLHNKRRGHWANSTKMGYVVLLTFLSKSGIITWMLNWLPALFRNVKGPQLPAEHYLIVYLICYFADGCKK